MDAQQQPSQNRILITSGPTREPIDKVRYLANRSTGHLGAALADAAADLDSHVTLLLGPQAAEPTNTAINTTRFQTAADLQAALAKHAPECDVLIMAAAVADYRPIPAEANTEKIQRKTDTLTLHLEPIPDLIATEAARKRPDQFFVAFALEPRDRLIESAQRKLIRKGVDAIVANPLETMGADTIEAVYITANHPHKSRDASPIDPNRAHAQTNGPIPKAAFAAWLLDLITTDLARINEATPKS